MILLLTSVLLLDNVRAERSFRRHAAPETGSLNAQIRVAACAARLMQRNDEHGTGRAEAD
jgi:hypothetical protein